MKLIKRILLTLSTTIIAYNVWGQANPFINVLPSNSGIVSVGSTIDIAVTIGNSGPSSTIPQAKLRPIIQVPPSVTFLPNAQQTGLPAGWTILSNNGAQLRICNSTDPIPVNTSRIITLKVQGVTVTPPQTFSGNINFGNGTTCAAGTSVAGDQITDNSATSTIEVVPAVPLPVILTNFSVSTDHCSAHLYWSTSSEVNCEEFEIERSESANAAWRMIGNVKARNYASTNSTYYFKDNNILNNDIVKYRLKIKDKDGSFMYSQALNALMNCDEHSISVFPNPVVHGNLVVSVNGAEDIIASLTSVNGQLVKKFMLKNGSNNLDVSALSNGIYILNVQFAGGSSQHIKVDIQQ